MNPQPEEIEEEEQGDEDGSSERVESSDEAYRRRMELEDARRQDPSYTDPVDSYKKEQEKIDKLPEESRDNIRDQLIDVIGRAAATERRQASSLADISLPTHDGRTVPLAQLARLVPVACLQHIPYRVIKSF